MEIEPGSENEEDGDITAPRLPFVPPPNPPPPPVTPYHPPTSRQLSLLNAANLAETNRVASLPYTMTPTFHPPPMSPCNIYAPAGSYATQHPGFRGFNWSAGPFLFISSSTAWRSFADPDKPPPAPMWSCPANHHRRHRLPSCQPPVPSIVSPSSGTVISVSRPTQAIRQHFLRANPPWSTYCL